ncbi:hypothetical protein PAT3040_07099 [Paenibacillus agaridevorans]|uniref:N-acetyltransferase domain-containing protein n=1 Tax=Paenibacillus agaridevorans TaxID=171404 RepID=A0A2R5F6M0_9BACL|nr:GNAT family N-acetyltransferase [Paenibacillus agaridevorans]GBG12231.1 hypothetical protein PAT3040_07099 [Paenibacillus agaridevorans]
MEAIAAEYKRLEEISLNGWPALQTVLLGGWLVRFADGYTKRSNSVSAIYDGFPEADEKIRICEALYRARGLAPVFKVTPFVHPGDLDDRLQSRGYGKIDHTLVKAAPLAGIEAPSREDLTLTEEITEVWLDAVAELQKLTPSQRETTRRMFANRPLKQGFAMLEENGRPVACGLAVIEDGWAGLYDIVTAPEARGRGFGEAITRGLFRYAHKQGARMGYLLVVRDNTAANGLYDKLGFETVYEYWYRIGTNGKA